MTSNGLEPNRSVTVLDLGVGNLGNVERAFTTLGACVEITADPEVVAGSRCLVMPGVGAFEPARRGLRGGLEVALRESLGRGAWLLGICVGYQLLFESSDEGGVTEGLGLLGGHIRELPATVPVPHIGWNRLMDLGEHPLMAGVSPEDAVYFVHSYAPFDVPDSLQIASTQHGVRFPAVAGRDRVLGVQFHPEKSGAVGLSLLANYLEICHGPVSGD